MALNKSFALLKRFKMIFSLSYQPRTNTIYLGNGLLDYQAVHFTHLSLHYLGHPQSLTVVCESNPSDAYKHALRQIAPANTIHFISLPRHILNSLPVKILRLFLVLPLAIILALVTNRKSLLNNSYPWFITQLLHGLWDHSLRFSPSSTVNPPLRRKTVSAVSNIHHLFKAIQFAAIYRPSLVFLGHSVYSGRSSLAFYRLLPIPVYLHSFNTLNRMHPHYDSSLFTPTAVEANSFLCIARSLDATSFWDRRLAGNSNYFDATVSFQGLKTTDITPVNIVYLHIFKDSPFNHIDRTRIFADYFDWTLETLRILGESSETWLIKTHPSSQRWGEDSLSILDTLINNVFPQGLPAHILTDESSLSNSSLLTHAKRVVTFSGSVHLESAAYGVKPIVVSSTLLETLSPSLVHKPTSLDHYRSLLSCPSSSPIFRLSHSETYLSRQILQLKEDHLTYSNDFSILPLYPADTGDYQNTVFKQFIDSYNPENTFTKQLAFYLSRGLTRSTSSSILQTFYTLTSQSASN